MLFSFDYQIECYVPEAKRKFGYFALPILWGDELVGRADCKAERKSQTLEVRQLTLESNAELGEALLAAICDGLQFFCIQNQCQQISLKNCKTNLQRSQIKSIQAKV